MLCSWVDAKATRKLMAAAARAASDGRSISFGTDVGEASQQDSTLQQERKKEAADAAANAASPSWLRALCDRGDYGLNGRAVYVDYETYVQCRDDGISKSPAFDFLFDVGKSPSPIVHPTEA